MSGVNKIVSVGKRSHAVPTVPNLVVEMRDGNHNGTAVYLRSCGTYVFADLDGGLPAEEMPRAILVTGHLYEYGVPEIFAMDRSDPDGFMIIGLEEHDDLSFLSEGAQVLWDSLSSTL